MFHAYRTNQRPFGCPVLSEPDVMLCAMPVTVRTDGLDELLDRQFSVVSRGQLLDLGMKDAAVQWRVRAGGPWQALLPGVYLALTGAPNLLQKEMAALLYAGPGSLVTGPVALMHHGLRRPVLLETVDVLVPGGRQRVSAGFARLHRTYRMPSRIITSGPVRFVLAARAVADTARLLADLRDVRAVVADAVQRGRCSVADLAEEARDGPMRGSAMFRSVLGEVAEGIRSTAKGDLRDLIRAAGLPAPLFSASLYIGDTFIARPDAWWPEAGVVVEVDSYEWHLSPADADRTRKRHDLLCAAGVYPLHFSPRQIRREPAEVVRMIKEALDRGLRCPPLPIRTIPCPESQPTRAAGNR
jgi:very-short-patch-repair endonuclease